jgi:acyl carrier protein
MEKDNEERLTQVFRAVFGDDELVLSHELTADDIDGWDSLSHIRLILSTQKEFGVKFSPAETGRLKNVGELLALIQSKKST